MLTHVGLCIRTNIHAYTQTYARTNTRIHDTHIYAYIQCHTYMQTYVHAYVHQRIHLLDIIDRSPIFSRIDRSPVHQTPKATEVADKETTGPATLKSSMLSDTPLEPDESCAIYRSTRQQAHVECSPSLPSERNNR